jgi:hypothetical protein
MGSVRLSARTSGRSRPALYGLRALWTYTSIRRSRLVNQSRHARTRRCRRSFFERGWQHCQKRRVKPSVSGFMPPVWQRCHTPRSCPLSSDAESARARDSLSGPAEVVNPQMEIRSTAKRCVTSELRMRSRGANSPGASLPAQSDGIAAPPGGGRTRYTAKGQPQRPSTSGESARAGVSVLPGSTVSKATGTSKAATFTRC